MFFVVFSAKAMVLHVEIMPTSRVEETVLIERLVAAVSMICIVLRWSLVEFIK